MKNNEAKSTISIRFKEALKLSKMPVIISLLITPVRYSLELMGIPENYIFLVGLLWFTIGIAVYWAIKTHKKNNAIFRLLLALVIFSPISRIPVALAWWVDTKWSLGTHYGLYFTSFDQVLLNQVVYGGLLQIFAGFIAGSITFAIMNYRTNSIVKNNTLQNG